MTTSSFTVRYTSVDPKKIKWRLVRNPAYNNDHVSLNNWCRLDLRDQRKPLLQETLEKDIAEHGFRNPIVIYALPEGLFLVFGGSRLRAAHNLDFASIPVIANDYTGKYDGATEVTEQNWEKFFLDTPVWHEFGEFGFDCHYGLERMRREEWAMNSAGFDWLKHKDYDRSFIEKEMPWALDLVPDDTPKHSKR